MRKVLGFALLTAMVAAAQGDVTTNFVLADQPEIDGVAYNVWQMRITTTSDWTNAILRIELTQGSVYNHPYGDDGDGPPLAVLLPVCPDLGADSFVCRPGRTSCLSQERACQPYFWWCRPPNVVGDPDDTVVDVSWFDTPVEDPVTDAVIAQITLTADASGTLSGVVYDVDSMGVGCPLATDRWGAVVAGHFVKFGAGDADGNGSVDDDDLSVLLAHWGRDTDWAGGEFSGTPPVDDNDLSILLAQWSGSGAGDDGEVGLYSADAAESECEWGDCDQDGDVDEDDLSLLLAHWGQDVTGYPDGGCSRGEISGVPPVDDDDLALMCVGSWEPPVPRSPEPATTGLMAVGAMLLGHKRRH